MLTAARSTPKNGPTRSSVLTIFCERICFDIALLTDIATLCIAPIRKVCAPVITLTCNGLHRFWRISRRRQESWSFM
ncbi:unnamed protein product [Cylicocyclus nassatus]|uniref:Uncharacterized protein n=1 Tax=Cylicocyclus nassatus TaxID=53992 RepID=A0AA36GW95_CYLNA|nr:unnamed protein product [Cylicocyclus nassatus]